MWRETARAFTCLCLFVLLLPAASPARAANNPKGILGFRWDDSVQSVAQRARSLKFTTISEEKSLSEVTTTGYSGRVFDMEAEVRASFFRGRLFDVTIRFPRMSYGDFAVLVAAHEDRHGGAKTYHGSLGNFGAKSLHWGIDETGIALIMTEQESVWLEYTNLTKKNEALREWRRVTEQQREKIRRQL